ncbi:MAG: peptidoglycan-binding protein [Clostridium sp.]|nr:peptidoglycan-binding protein [Clostridium sp.]
MIANCGSDEKGKYSGGAAGDQTGKEYCVRSWYNRPWRCVLRHPSEKVRKKIAELAKNAANNDNIGYDQGQRLTFYNALKANNWKPKNIKTKCEADCSSSTAAIIIAVGYLLGIEKLQKVNPSSVTGNLRSALKSAGFSCLTESKYLTGDSYLLPGDILLNDGHHVAINLDAGSKTGTASSKGDTVKSNIPPLAEAIPNLKKGSKGTQVRNLQSDLNYVMKSGLDVDGDFGSKTQAALKAFQKKYSLSVDGIYGSKSKAKMKTLLT